MLFKTFYALQTHSMSWDGSQLEVGRKKRC